jgi:cytidylate kinase
MVAAVEERARRRLSELREENPDLSLETVIDAIEQRDRRDAERAVGPLRRADDAVELDTTGLSIDEQIEEVIARARERKST